MTPTPGRIVLFHFTTIVTHATKGPYTQVIQTRPAIVTSISTFGSGGANLHVFFEPGDGVLREEREDPFRENVPFGADPEFPTNYSWSWPPRTKEM